MSGIDRLYARAPLWGQNLMVSARGLQFRLRRASTAAIRAHLATLLESQWWDAERFHAYQQARLRLVLADAWRHVPHYREQAAAAGWDAGRMTPGEAFRTLPILEKSDLRGSEERFLSEAVPPGKRVAGFTSGTTGTPIRLYETRAGFSERWAYAARLRSWAGVGDPVHPRRVQFTGRTIVPLQGRGAAARTYWRHNLPGRAMLCSTTHLTADTVADYARAMRRYAPELIDGYPSALLVVARVAGRAGIELPRPRAIITSAETLLPEHRAEIEAAFRARVHDQYAASEPSCFWGECEHGVLHQSPEYGISEILRDDGTPAAPGEEGDVVVTSFLNPVMPLIRYRVGDRAVVGSPEPCACGRHMPRVERVVGRRDDILYVPVRGWVGRLDPAFKGLSNVVEAQVVQEALDRVRVLLVPAPGYLPQMGEGLLANLREKLGPAVHLVLEEVDAIPRGPNGKFRSVVSRVKDQYPEAF